MERGCACAETHAFRYADGMGWALEFARIAADGELDDKEWTTTYFGWTAVSPILEMAFEHVEKRPYVNEATFVTALITGASKVDRTELDAAKLVPGGGGPVQTGGGGPVYAVRRERLLEGFPVVSLSFLTNINSEL